ncbi:hypothetical protein IMZ38_04410 [Thermosphaera chiliense]|uniref:Uncharacterized protein n=1 Tax=Thermosphaera chiliense TaxID=3402707 RepID=A0A7M1UPK0_9CREN|nr:hypothetical protein [Thermosphaera aggregans]QOR93899.1 hypothetical protein IMZ38_04410 [Thermosphaera aggregans]
MLSSDLKEKVFSFLQKYGDKGFIVLKTALSIAKDPNIDHKLGDFSFKHLVLKLNSMGFSYNPVNLIRILEKEFGLIEKTYSSSNQTWWRFKDIDAVEEAVYSENDVEKVEDPKIRLIAVKYRSLEPAEIYAFLQKTLIKPSLTPADKAKFRSMVFNEIDQLVKLVDEMYNYEEFFEYEISFIKEIFKLAEKLSRRIENEHLRGFRGRQTISQEDILRDDHRGHS